MASFDPSIISQIPDMAGNPYEARLKAYKLADLMTQEQSNKLTLAHQKEQEDEYQKTKEIMKGADLSTNEGRVALSQKLSQAGLAKPAMEALTFSGEQQSRDLQQAAQRMQVLKLATDEIGPTAKKLLDQSITQGPQGASLNPQGYAQARAAYQQELARVLPMLPPELRNKLPPELPADPRQGIPMLQKAIANSEQARQMIAQENKQKDEARADKRLDLSEQSAARQDRRLADQEEKDARKVQEDREGAISDDAAQLAVDRILNGEQARDVLANYGRGAQGARNITKVQNLLAESAKARGLDSKDVTAAMVQFKGLIKEQQVEAGIAGRISYAEKEINQIGPKVIEQADKVGRGSFVPWNKLRNMAATSISDPNLKQLKVYLNTLTNSYDVLGGRGGTDVEKRAHNRELLDAADSPEALKAAVGAIVQEAELSRTAAAQSREVDKNALGPQPARPQTPGAAQAPTATGPNGQKLILRNGQWVPLG